MEIVLGIEKKMSDEGYKSNISRIAGSGAGSMALAEHAASVTILSPANNTQLKGLKKHYGSVPEFSFVERNGKRTGLAALRGKVWIANFIYTNCTDTCPL
jgi:cytochrome oxidase Cu insertion factor (SCO1/SenC/PrrC family)